MKKYILLLSLTVISCSKGDDNNIATTNNLTNNEVAFVNSGNIYFENNTCKCPDASNGDKDIINGVTYTAVNNLSIKDEISNGNYNLCTTLVTNMSGKSISGVFQNFFNNNFFNSNISFWDVSNVVDMREMFYRCGNIDTIDFSTVDHDQHIAAGRVTKSADIDDR